jgi:hypothetical protein
VKRPKASARSKRKPRALKTPKRATTSRAMPKRGTPNRATPKRATPKRSTPKRAAPAAPPTPALRAPTMHKGPKVPRLERVRRTLDDSSSSIPSSLNLDRHGSATRTGRFETAERLDDHATMTPAITGGDIDADIEDAYFSGNEAPGGDNPTPDQDIVDDIGRAVGIEYQDAEELKAVDKITERDRKRWELDPASSEDYPERK